MSERVTLLAGGDTIYLYAVGNPNIDAMEAVLDVAYPGTEVERRTISVSAWEAARPKLIEAGVEVVDVRETAVAEPVANLIWESAGTDEPGDQNALSRLGRHAYWSLGPDGGNAAWAVELIVRDCDLEVVPEAGLSLGRFESETLAKRAAQQAEGNSRDASAHSCDEEQSVMDQKSLDELAARRAATPDADWDGAEAWIDCQLTLLRPGGVLGVVLPDGKPFVARKESSDG